VFALNLTYDHRIVDGVPAARFLNSFRDELNRAIPAGAGEAGGEG
jgi:pyruvate/2-oxoglutarate dehydrogenase complex dihydrolipoamide acyltransferase (E2) component